MRILICLFIVLFCGRSLSAQDKKQITLEDLWKNNTFRVKSVPGFNAMKDGIHYTQMDRESTHTIIRTYDLQTGKPDKTLFDNELQQFSGNKLAIDNYAFSSDEQKILLYTETMPIYRRSALERVYVYDIAAGSVKLLDYDKVLHASFSPDGQKVAFVKNNNLYYKDLQKDIIVPVTTDGEKNRIINGSCDWVYEEEFGFSKAFEWSEDGATLAFYRFDESLVPDYTIAKYTGLYPDEYEYKYPKAGERNSVVQIKLYDLKQKSTTNVNIGRNTDIYIPRIKWTHTSGKLCVYRLNRLQNKLDLLLTDTKDGATVNIYTEQNKWYLNINDEITFLPGGHSLILSTERDGYYHLYKWDWKSEKLTNLTPGDYDVDALTGIDTARHLLYYTAAGTSPLQRQLYVTNWQGEHTKCLTPEKGIHSITACEGYNFFLDKYSRIDKVPVYYLRNAQGDIVRTLEDNKDLEAKMTEYAMGNIHFMKIKGATGKLNAWIMTPPDFDSTKKYPVLLYQYSGPGSQEVADRFPLGNYFWHELLAEKGYIIVCADGTGTGFRGEEFRKKTYLQLGKLESDDQIAVAKNLAKLPYVDAGRIGIWGWSYGGFMASTCIMKGNNVFKAALAIAPVTNWRYYDNIYTERYMRTPQENPKGYDENAPEKMADSLKGKFLFIHGTADDNVHFQNSVMMNNALINANKQFENEYYPDKNHSIYGGNTRLHLYTRMTDFILKNL